MKSFGTNVPCPQCGEELQAFWNIELDPPAHTYRCSKCRNRGVWRGLGKQLHPAQFDRDQGRPKLSAVSRPTKRRYF